MAGRHGHVTADDHLHVIGLPQSRVDAVVIVLPELRPVSEPYIGVAVHVEEHAVGAVAPDRVEGGPIERGVGFEVRLLELEHAAAVGFRAAVEDDLRGHGCPPLLATASTCSTVGAWPARVVRRTSRTSSRSKRRARCMVQRLSHITRSLTRQACEYTNSHWVASSVRAARDMRASGTVQPSMSAAWEERKSDLRPVIGCARTRRWRTGAKAASSSAVRSTMPIASRE